MLIFATEAQLSDWTGQPSPSNAVALLREASIRVRSTCQADVFDVLPNGLPADDDKRIAMQEATCSQAAVWAATGVDPTAGAGGLAKEVVSSGIDGASTTFNTAATDAAKAESIDRLCLAAYTILRNAGLASSAVLS